MAQMHLRNATVADLYANAPPTAKSVSVVFEITPANGSLLVYLPPTYDNPARIDGTGKTLDIAVSPEHHKMFIQLIGDTKSFVARIVGFTDNF
ncbi:hypothetical protein [Paludibacterium sp.]|uniref:hypothetical protein n=1 Tax=Paludibacterium sp. TaxID=1917523 RepID=UPI0025CE5564|nr:hypothetical protein [Paludibacterium sp.]MBV8648463.1 hypothetical protein [Paludibacterium sp.]